jgi:hypothetical protein
VRRSLSLSEETSSPITQNILVGFVTPDDLVKSLGISRRTLARWHAMRIGPARCMVGRTILYRAEAVQQWLTASECDATVGRRRRR